MRNIKAGEEIFVSYGKTYWKLREEIHGHSPVKPSDKPAPPPAKPVTSDKPKRKYDISQVAFEWSSIPAPTFEILEPATKRFKPARFSNYSGPLYSVCDTGIEFAREHDRCKLVGMPMTECHCELCNSIRTILNK